MREKAYITGKLDDGGGGSGKYALITETGNKLTLEITENNKLTATLFTKTDIQLSQQTVTLPIAESIESGYYDEPTGEIVFVLVSGREIRVPVGSLLSNFATKDELAEVENKIPVKISQLENDSEFITAEALVEYVKESDLAKVAKTNDYNDLDNLPEIPSIEGLATETYVQNYVDEHGGRINEIEVNGELVPIVDKKVSLQIPSVDGLATETYVNNKISEVEAKIPSTDTFATKEELSEVEAKIPDVSTLATKAEVEEVAGDLEDLAIEVSTMGDAVDEVKSDITALEADKQDKLTAGENITIEDNVIKAVDTKYTAGENVEIKADNSINVDLSNYATLADLQIGKQITSQFTVGGVAIGTVFPATTTLAQILEQILAGAVPPTGVTFYYGPSDNIPTSVDGLQSLTGLDADLIVSQGITQHWITGKLVEEETQYPVVGIDNSLDLVEWTVEGAESIPIPFVKLTVDNINIYYQTTPIDDSWTTPPGTTHKLRFTKENN